MDSKFCPYCEAMTPFSNEIESSNIPVRGETITITHNSFECLQCHNKYDSTSVEDDPLHLAYREYRSRHGMLQPDDIRHLRQKFNLTQREFASLLGWGFATLSRYENGALQDESHDKLLRLILDKPTNLELLINKKPDTLSENKINTILAKIHNKKSFVIDLNNIVTDSMNIEPSILNGFKAFDIAKFYNAILLFCKKGTQKTKLNKLLFYADFKHFSQFGISLTGATYAHLPYGPVPNDYDLHFTAMLYKRLLAKHEEQCGQYMAEIFTSRATSDNSIFSTSELTTLEHIASYFNNYNSTQIKNASHNEIAYIQTKPGNIISYEHASHLKI